MRPAERRTTRHNMDATQRGAALLISLVILLVLTVLALSSMQSSSLQERMVAAQRDGQIALEGAEHALKAGEALLSQAAVPTFGSGGGLYSPRNSLPADADESKFAPIGTEVVDPAFWEKENRTRMATMPKAGDGSDLLAEPPQFFIELLPVDAIAINTAQPLNTGDGYCMSCGETAVIAYRIVARSTGRSGEASRIVEAHVFR